MFFFFLKGRKSAKAHFTKLFETPGGLSLRNAFLTLCVSINLSSQLLVLIATAAPQKKATFCFVVCAIVNITRIED